jgi:uncharacterized protein YndB with AHSA1/START domain
MNMGQRWVLAFALMAAPAAAEVKSATDTGFEVTKTVTVKATPAAAYAALGKPGQWWSGAHTYSGKAANLSLALKAGGCFCEVVPADKGTVEHGRVVFASPGKMLRFQGGLGPIQSEAAVGTMTWMLKPVAGGTEITQSYVVGGYVRGGAKAFAPLVDLVLGEQIDGLKRYLDR